jgi:hypothetical protein
VQIEVCTPGSYGAEELFTLHYGNHDDSVTVRSHDAPPPSPPPSPPPPYPPHYPPLTKTSFHTAAHTRLYTNRDAVVVDIIIGGMTLWSSQETAALKASLAESLGVQEGTVYTEDEGFEVKADFTVSGMSAQEWLSAPAAFSDAMQQELGFPVDITGVNIGVVDGNSRRRRLKQTTGAPQALEVLFTVQGLGDVGSTLTTMAKVVEITSDTDTATSRNQGSSKSRLLAALTKTEGQIIQVRAYLEIVVSTTSHI